jgi:hypothetical protein
VSELEQMHGFTFGQLVDCEPRLETLLWEARRAGAACRSQADAHRAFSTLRSQLSELVGFSSRHRRHRLLGSVGAYEVVYWRLLQAVKASAKWSQSTWRTSAVHDSRAA